MPRQKTKNEIKKEFISNILSAIDYWEKEQSTPTTRQKMMGVAFSILVMLDGEDANMPAFIVAPDVNSLINKDCIKDGEDYYPAQDKEVKGNISGDLHELFAQMRKP